MSIALLYTLLAVAGVSAVSLIGAATLSWKESFLRRTLFILVSLAAGALLGDALIHLIPESFEGLGASRAALLVLLGMLLFFILEKFLHWHHHHTSEEGREHTDLSPSSASVHPLGSLVLISDGLHNFIDGVLIGASFLVGTEVGIATTVAVILHEIPQEIGDFGILLHAGFARRRALFMNFLSSLAAIAGALAVFAVSSVESILPVMLALGAGSFLYIASSDLVPELHKTKNPWASVLQLLAMVAGGATMYLLLFLE